MELSINFITAAIAGLLVIAFLFLGNGGSKNQNKQVAKTSSAEPASETQEEVKSTSSKKRNKRSKKKKKKKKSKPIVQEAKSSYNIDENDDEDDEDDDSNDESTAYNRSRMGSSKNRNKAKKKPAARLEIPGGKKAHAGSVRTVEDPGSGWTTVGTKKKSKSKVEKPSTAAPVKKEGVSFVTVPGNKVGVIIGAKHVTRLLIENKSGCSVEVPSGQDSSVKTVKVKLTGNGSQRQLGQAIINDLVELGFSPRLDPGLKIYKISIPTSLLPVLRGNKFTALKALEEDANVKIALPNVTGKMPTCRVKVGGKKSGLERTKKSLAQLSKYYHCEVTHPGLVHQEVYNCELSYIIGPGGQTIRSIQGDTKTKIYTPKPGSPNPNIVVVGKKADVARALSQMAKVVGSDVSTLTSPYE